MAETHVNELLALDPWSIRFQSPETERAFVRWRIERAFVVRRLQVLVSTIFWGSLIALMLAFDHVTAAGVSVAVMTPILAWTHVTYVRRSVPWATVSSLAGYAGSGLLGIWLGFVSVGGDLHAAVVGGVVLACHFQLGNAHEPIALASLAVFSYVAAAIVALALMFHDGLLGLAPLIFETWVLLVAFAMATVMGIAADGARRRTYRQERIIENARGRSARCSQSRTYPSTYAA